MTFFNPDGSLLSEKEDDIVECESSGDSASTTNSESSQNPRDYKYHQNGTKRVKTEQGFFVRKYYKCPTQGCFATMYENIAQDGSVSYNFFGSHSHSPPEKPPVDRSVKNAAKQMLLCNMKPSQVQKELLLSSDPISIRYLPTRQQLSNMLGYLKRRYLPSPNALNNIMAMYHDNFLIDLKLFPHLIIILGAPQARQLLLLYGQTIFVDGTFELCEGKLILTTLMISVEEVGVPVFFLLSESRSSKTYQYFLRQLVEFTENSYSPQNVLGDFEMALQQAFQVVFPTARYFGDSFHFIQANLRWLRHNKIDSELQDNILSSLRLLWASSTRESFHDNLNTLLTMWRNVVPEYAKYFESMWIAQVSPLTWAYFARANKEVPSGDHKLEGWHNRLQHLVMTQKSDAVDHVVTNLRNEWLYYWKLLESPSLLQSEIHRIRNRQIRNSHRATLRNLVISSSSVKNRNSSSLSIESNTIDHISQDQPQGKGILQNQCNYYENLIYYYL